MADVAPEPLHPMYESRPKDSDLWQGDIISRKVLVEDERALRGHQPYIESRTDLVAFCVATQTCDLVKNRCVEFVCLAVIRKLTDVLGTKAVESKKREGNTFELLRKVVNHNENKPGYFFLHEAPNLGIGDDWVVDLRTVFSVLSRLHYEQLQRSRIVSLKEVFGNKLGWMMGSMFARVPTPSWNDFPSKQSDSEYIQGLLKKVAQSPHADPYPFEIPFGSSEST